MPTTHTLPSPLRAPSLALLIAEPFRAMLDALGSHVHDYFIRNKRREWNAYKEQVTPWELDRYLGSL